MLCNPYKVDRNADGDAIILYTREDIPSTVLNSDLPIEGFFVKARSGKKTWLLCSSYNFEKIAQMIPL